jgi:hypothetical protein
MRIATMLDDLIGYFSRGTSRMFSLDRTDYPKTGVQPFEGDINKKDRKDR